MLLFARDEVKITIFFKVKIGLMLFPGCLDSHICLSLIIRVYFLIFLFYHNDSDNFFLKKDRSSRENDRLSAQIDRSSNRFCHLMFSFQL